MSTMVFLALYYHYDNGVICPYKSFVKYALEIETNINHTKSFIWVWCGGACQQS